MQREGRQDYRIILGFFRCLDESSLLMDHFRAGKPLFARRGVLYKATGARVVANSE